MVKSFFAAAFIIFYLAGAGQTKVRLDNSVTITIDFKINEDESLQTALKKINKDIIYASVIYPTTDSKPALFAVSKYSNYGPLSMDSAFSVAVNHVPDNMKIGYALVDHRTYEKGGKFLRFKKSKLTFEGGEEIYNVMYYFMRGNASSEYYELKMSGKKEEAERNKQILEKIFFTVSFD